MTDSRSGTCQCGAISYAYSGDPLFTYACHCTNCQKRTGSAFSLGMMVLLDGFNVEGELTEWTRVSDTGQTNTRYSCADCGNIIYGVGDATPGMAKLQPGTLHDTTDVEPEIHLWTRSKQTWIEIPEDAPSFETQPDGAGETLEAVAEFRRAKNR